MQAHISNGEVTLHHSQCCVIQGGESDSFNTLDRLDSIMEPNTETTFEAGQCVNTKLDTSGEVIILDEVNPGITPSTSDLKLL